MKIETTRFGTIDISEEEVFSFPEGLIGFAEHKNFIIYDYQPENPFKWLQASDNPGLAFIVVEPGEFMAEYKPKIPECELDFLGLKNVKDARFYATVIVPKDPKKMYANLLGPVVVNPEKRIGKQIILQSDEYSTCHYILEEFKNSFGAKNAGSIKTDE